MFLKILVFLNNFFIFLDCFDILMLKNNFLKIKKFHFNVILNKNYFKLPPLSQFQIDTY
jgi:hypothetical protein